MLNDTIKKLLRKRIIIGNIDFFLFFFFWGILQSIFIKAITIPENILLFILSMLLPFIISFSFYFGIIPKLTHGYTFLGYLFKIKIVKLDNKEISIVQYILRALYAGITPFKFLNYLRVRANNKGQFYYDRLFNTTVLDDKINLDTLKKEDKKYYSYYFWGENIQYMFYFFGIIFGLVIIKSLICFIL